MLTCPCPPKTRVAAPRLADFAELLPQCHLCGAEGNATNPQPQTEAHGFPGKLRLDRCLLACGWEQVQKLATGALRHGLARSPSPSTGLAGIVGSWPNLQGPQRRTLPHVTLFPQGEHLTSVTGAAQCFLNQGSLDKYHSKP